MDRLSGARFVHLATHGSLWEGSPYRTELALAGVDSLTVPDLVGAETAIDVAVLSACDSQFQPDRRRRGRRVITGTTNCTQTLVKQILTRMREASGLRMLVCRKRGPP
jgi:CHAT domain-containing protein